MLITTLLGPMDPSLLERKDIVIDNDNEYTKVTEYWMGDQCIHRAVHVTLKTQSIPAGFVGNLG